MEKKINIAEILKDCPSGMELDCTKYSNVYFVGIDNYKKEPKIKLKIETFGTWCSELTLDKYGKESSHPNAKCMIFPKGKTTWEGFQKPFEDGDVAISNVGDIHLLRTKDSSYCAYRESWGLSTKFDETTTTLVKVVRLATEEEKEKLFQAIKDNGYKWNLETKTLEKLVKPRFKVGNRIKFNCNNYQFDIKEITDTHYNLVEVEYKLKYIEPISEDKNWELVPSKFDISTLIPFESRVLTRDDGYSIWQPNVWGLYDKEHRFPYVTTGNRYRYCIPYEGNEHLIGKTDDCDKYFKNWE